MLQEKWWSVLVNGANVDRLQSAIDTLRQVPGSGTVEGFHANVASEGELQALSDIAVETYIKALAKELEERKSSVKAGLLSPGIMITDFTVKALGGKQAIELPEKTKRFYNIMGDYPDRVAAFQVKEMLANTKNGAHIQWLTGPKAAWRFMIAGIRKRDYFRENGNH